MPIPNRRLIHPRFYQRLIPSFYRQRADIERHGGGRLPTGELDPDDWLALVTGEICFFANAQGRGRTQKDQRPLRDHTATNEAWLVSFTRVIPEVTAAMRVVIHRPDDRAPSGLVYHIVAVDQASTDNVTRLRVEVLSD